MLSRTIQDTWVQRVSKSFEVYVHIVDSSLFRPTSLEDSNSKIDLIIKSGMKINMSVQEKAMNSKVTKYILLDHELMMNKCFNNAVLGIVLVNLNTFNSDVLTSLISTEMGFVSAISNLKNIIVIGYLEDERLFDKKGELLKDENSIPISAIKKTKGSVHNTFEEAVEAARCVSKELEESYSESLIKN